MDWKTLGMVSVAVLLIVLVIYLIVRKTNEGYRSDKKNAMFNVAPKFWSWKNIKSQL